MGFSHKIDDAMRGNERGGDDEEVQLTQTSQTRWGDGAFRNKSADVFQ